ncbi:HET-domain-containing protein [Daldinia loculata]|nr:HET-domain-containing protein [Daldinia loculata]
MRLLHVHTRKLEEFNGDSIPPYAILSHTWCKHEITFQDLLKWGPKILDGYAKIEGCCQQAAKDGLHYVWIDTCCIDKSSSAELSEGINSMFQWYKRSMVCYIYLADVSAEDDPYELSSEFRRSRWFTRGWTLQETLAPMELVFFDKTWNQIQVGRLIRAANSYRGQNSSALPSQEKYLNRLGLLTLLSDITNIPKKALDTGDFSKFCAAARLAWAANRKTTRVEDVAYSLLGLLEVNMPLLYGEGDKAFLRLQEEIIKSRNDDSLLAWGYRLRPNERPKIYADNVLARSPSDFTHCHSFQSLESDETSPQVPLTTSHSAMTNIGIQTAIPIRPIDPKIGVFMAILRCAFTVDGYRCHLVVPLVNTKGGDKNHYSRAPGSPPFHIQRAKLFSLINNSRFLFFLSRVPLLWNCFVTKATTTPIYIRENPLTAPPRVFWPKPNKKEPETMSLYIGELVSAGFELLSFYPPWISKKSASGSSLVLRFGSWNSTRFVLIFSRPKEFSPGYLYFAVCISQTAYTISEVEHDSALEYLMEQSHSLEINMDRHGIKQKELDLEEGITDGGVRLIHHISFKYMFGDIRISCSTGVVNASRALRALHLN